MRPGRRRAALAALSLMPFLTPVQAAAKLPEYGPIGGKVRFGYEDRVNPDGGHTVLVVLPAKAKPEDVRLYWNRRAEELCPSGVSRRNIFRLDRPERITVPSYQYRQMSIGSRTPLSLEAEGYVYCNGEAKAETAEAAPAKTPSAP